MASLLDNITRPSAAILQLSVLLGATFVLLKVLQFYWKRKKLIKALEAFPGPPKHWLYGHNHLVRIAGLSQGGFVPVRMEKDWMGCACALLLSLPTGENFCTGSAKASAGQEKRVLDMWCATFSKKKSRFFNHVVKQRVMGLP